ncbi:MAG: hypothetical protein FJX76_23005 [Armatimonadetes bacterium]|nr:hypothetical protein [Armatimonadota bacterium]
MGKRRDLWWLLGAVVAAALLMGVLRPRGGVDLSRPLDIGGVTAGMTSEQVAARLGAPRSSWHDPPTCSWDNVWRYYADRHGSTDLDEVHFAPDARVVELAFGHKFHQDGQEVLHAGATEEDVRAILGPPDRVVDDRISGTGWWYLRETASCAWFREGRLHHCTVQRKWPTCAPRQSEVPGLHCSPGAVGETGGR